ncbi:hypothetical protein CR513_37250, partial [Mucuna pruriens]
MWPYCLFPIRVVLELSGLKCVLLVRIIEDNTNKMFKEGTSVSHHLNEFQGIIDQMSGMVIKFEDETLGLLLLNTLPKSWETFKVTITNLAPNGVISLQIVKGSVLNKEMRRKAQGSSSQFEENKGKKGKSKKKDDDDDDDRVTTATGDDLVILRDFESVNLVSDESMWIIDSGATLHVTLRKEFFTSYILGDFGVLKMGNDGVTKVIDVGDVCLQTNTGMQLWLRGVKHALDVCFNLISVHMLDDGGYDNHFGHGKWKLTKGNLVVAKGEKISKLYWTKPLVAKDSVNTMDIEVKSFSGALYFVTSIDDCSRKLRVYVLKTKDHVLEKFKQFEALVERQLGKKVKYIRFDNGVALNTEVPDKIWFGKDVKYDHLRVFSCKAFVHVLKDERSKLDIKTRQCIFMGYGLDEYGYRMYDPVEKKLVKSHDVQFMKDHTIEDINKVKKSTLEKDNSLSEIEPVRMLVHDLDTVDNNVQNDEQHKYGDQQLEDGFDVPLDDDVKRSKRCHKMRIWVMLLKPPLVQLKRSNRERQSSTRSKHIDVRYHWIHGALDAKLLEFAKVHIDDNGADMMTKVVPRGKFEACCEIVGLAITST